MPKRDKFKKQGNQLSVASLFGKTIRENSSTTSTIDNQGAEPLIHSGASAERLNITGVSNEVNPLVLPGTIETLHLLLITKERRGGEKLVIPQGKNHQATILQEAIKRRNQKL